MRRIIDHLDDDIRQRCRFANPEHDKAYDLLARGITRWAPRGIPPLIDLAERRADGRWSVPWGAAPGEADGSAFMQVLMSVETDYLRPHQSEALAALARWDCGIAVMPCGGGKTQLGIALSRQEIRAPLVIVHSVDLAKQWAERFKRVLGINATVVRGSTGALEAIAETVRRCDPVIITVQTLCKLRRVPTAFGVVIVDEAHHAPAKTWTDALGKVTGLRLYGLTATPQREDGWTPAMLAWLGPIRHTTTHEELQAAGYTVVPRIVKVDTGAWTESADFAEMLGELARQVGRNGLIADRVEAHGAWPQLVLTARVDHAEHLADLLTRRGVRAQAATGKLSGKRRAELLAAVTEGDVQVLVATQLADEGLDLPELCALHLTLPARNAARTIQRVGRIMRPAPDKPTPVVYDYVDDDSLCQSQWRSRWKVYRELGVKAFERAR